MHSLRSTVLFIGAAFGAATSAFAGAGVVATVVTPKQTVTTYSTAAQPTYAGYTIVVANDGGNTINNIYFTAATSVTDPAEAATFYSAQGASCTVTNTAQTAIQCTIGQLAAGASAPVIEVLFKAPVKNEESTVGNDPETDKITFSGTTYYAETTGGPGSIPQNSIRQWEPVPQATLGTPVDTILNSVVPSSGGTFSTGSSVGIATPADPWVTIVTVPPSTLSTTAVVLEGDGVPVAPDLFDSRTSTLTIPGEFPGLLMITLRRDASTIAKGAKIATAQIYYNRYAPADTGLGLTVPACSSDPTLPRSKEPCIESRTAYPTRNSKKTPVAAGFEGDWEFVIKAFDNGKYAN